MAVTELEWAGGIVDFRNDTIVCRLLFLHLLHLHLEHGALLRFGNIYVHIITFLLLRFVPFWIFNISLLNIHDYVVRDVVGVARVVLYVFGLLYGGYWRIQLRKSCALAQEVRIENLYDVQDDSLYRKVRDNDEEDKGKEIVNAANSQPCGGNAGTMVSTSEMKNLDGDLIQTREE
ncbi:hypothetical protein Cni_G06607 [Canna indica]|uniref:Uncharacterized protein n=1 Tax=Canna indica TaxID=4628 RepID=A0AAQ3Q6Q0_9LILI|nr:hypothetical protein Cni_G06607 [Canna indica]